MINRLYYGEGWSGGFTYGIKLGGVEFICCIRRYPVLWNRPELFIPA